MDLLMMYKYAYWGVIEELKTLTKLYNMCVEVSDGDAAEEYENAIQKCIDNKAMISTILRGLQED